MKPTKEEVFMMYFANGYKYVTQGKHVVKCEGISVTDKEVIIKNLHFEIHDVRSQHIEHWFLPLRPFQDMMGEEILKYVELKNKDFDNIEMHTGIIIGLNQYDVDCQINCELYLLSIGIDLFRAIEQGYAINKKDIENASN